MLLAAASITLVGSTCVKAEVPGGVQAPGPKELYFKQDANQTAKLNVGVKYFIELKRDGQEIERVDSKFAFQSGDSIKIHVRPNIDAYAYIILKSGSQGEQSVLFPDAKARENNRISHGTDIALPQDGWLVFDEHAGVEKVCLVVSRSPVDANAYLKVPNKQHVLIASADTGSKDLVPVKILLAYSQPKDEDDKHSTSGDKQLYFPTASSSNAPKHLTPIAMPKVPTKSHGKGKTQTETTAVKPAERVSDAGVTTIVHTDPASTLAVDIELKHK